MHMKFCQGILSSNEVIALWLLKLKLLIPSSAKTNTWATFRPTVGPVHFFDVDWPKNEVLVGRLDQLHLKQNSLIDFINHKVSQSANHCLIANNRIIH